MKRHADIRLWLVGLAIFAVVVALGLWLQSASDYGIVDHQTAGTAQKVDAIQADWREQGVRWLAILAIAGDLIFIGVYSLGAWRAGRSFLRLDLALARMIGWLVLIAAAIFALTDYLETLLEFVQLLADRGDDAMAAVAAAMQVPKVGAFGVTFFGVVIGTILAHKPAPGAIADLD
jgi:hypothetical protein